MRMTAAAIRVRTSGAGVVFLLVSGFLGATWLLMQPLSASTPDPGFNAAATAADYKSVVLDFDGPIHAGRTVTSASGVTPETYAGTGSLSFAVGGVAVPAVKSDSGDDYTLTFTSAVEPHSTVITVNGGTAYSAAGDPIAIAPVAVPFSPADLTAFISGLKAMPGLPADAADLPFVGAWLEANDPSLVELIDGLASVSASGTEAEVLSALYALRLPSGGQPGDGAIADVTFTGRDVDVAFNPDAAGVTIDMTGVAGVETIDGTPFEVSLDGAAAVDMGLDGSIDLNVSSGAAAVNPGSSDLSVVLTSDATFDPSGRLGLVDVAAPDSMLVLDASLPLRLACTSGAASCAPAALAVPVAGDVVGTASLTVTTLEVLGTTQTFVGGPLLALRWNDLGDLGGVEATYDTSSVLAGFSTTSVADIAGGLQWVATWLTELETYGNVGAELPVIGGTAGELASLSTTLSEPTVAVGELLGLLGDLSAQDLLDLCDPDTVGDRVADLDLEAEELQSLLGVDTGDVATLLPQLQASAVEAAGTCEPLLGGIGYDETANAVTYTVDFDADHGLADALGGDLELDLAEAAGLDGISVAVRSGDWSSSAATIHVELTFGVKLGTFAQLGIAGGVTTTDFDGDGELDTVDTDVDGDGLPQSFTFAEGDRCRGLASLFGSSPSALQTHLGITAPTTNPDGTLLRTTDALCDAKVVTGTDMQGWKLGGTDDGTAVDALTADHVCAARAARFDLTAADFLARNTTLTASTCGTTTSPGPYSFDDATAMTARAALPHRFYVSAADDVVTADLHIDATGVGASADLGLLDLDVDVTHLAFDPSLAVGFTDPGTTTAKDDGKVDLWELASKADADDLDDIVDVAFTGAFAVNVDLYNEALMGDTPRGFDVYGDVADLDGGFEVHDTRLTEAPDADGKVHVGHDLGDLVNLKDITPGQALQMVVAVIENLTAMADSEVLATPLPFIDVTPQDMVDFAGSFADVVARVEERNPEDVTALQQALNDALVAAGMPGDLSIGVTAEELTLTFDGSRSITRTYPFSLDADDFPDLDPLSFAPSDGGATVTATAGVTFEPTIGISFDPDLELEDRIFVRDIAPEFDVSATADVFGSVHLGPAMASVRGTASIGDDGAELAIELLDADEDPLEEGAEITLGELGAILSDPTDRIGVAFNGPFGAELDVSATIAGIGTVRGTVEVEGNLNDLSATTIETSGFDDFELQLDLSTFVNGTTAAARFIGRTLEESEAISGDLPFLGDQLATLASVGTDIRKAAEEIDRLWRSLGEDPDQMEEFRSEINGHLQETLCTPLIAQGQECELTIALLTGSPATTDGATLGNAHTFEIGLRLGKDETHQVDLGGGLDLGPFGLEMSINPELRYGYGLDVVLGLNLTDGFYIRPGDSMGTDFIQLFAGMDTEVDASAELLGLSAQVTDGSISIGGSLGPDENSGGFAVGLVGETTELTMRDLTNRRTKIETLVAPGYDLDIEASLPLVVSADGIADLSLPVHLSVQGEGQTPPTPRLILGCRTAEDADLCPDGDEDITLDASTIVSQIIKPVLGDILGDPSINPLGHDAIRTALESDIPILDTKLRNLLRQAAIASGQEAAWSLIEFLVDVGSIDFDCGGVVPAAPGGGDCFNGQITLGWAEVVPTFVHHEPDDWGIPESITNLIESLRRISGATGLGAPKPPTTSTPAPTPTTPGTRPPGISRGSMLSFPILEDPGSALKLVLGKELAEPVTFIEFAPPPVSLGKGINFSQTLFDLDIGFLKGGLKVALQGRLGLTLHMGFGYDSTGISTGNVLDGFYLVDHEGFEVALGGSIQGLIDGHFSVFGDVVSVRFRGSAGARLEAGLDLFDESIALPKDSRNNGKLHLWEMGVIDEAYPSPFCMFALGARFDANLAFSGRAKVLGITVFDESWKGNWVLLDERLECTPNAVPAHVDDERRLVLNGGSFADFRFDGRGDVQEHFTLTQSGNDLSVSLVLTNAAGTQLGSTITKTYDATEFDQIHGELGAGPNSVSIASGITRPATLIGGDQADTLGGGGGDDSIDGAGGANVLTGGPGADLIRGGDGDDVLNGDDGNDDLEGGAGQNTYRFGNAWGTDHVEDAAATAKLDFSTVTTPLTGRAFFDEASMTTLEGEVSYWADEVMHLKGGTAADDVELNRSYPHGFAADLFDGGDTATLKFSGINRTISVEDTGASGDDELVVQGTASDDIFLFRADGPDSPDGAPATDGFVAMGARDLAAGDEELAADLAIAEEEAEAAGEVFDEEAWTDGYLEHRARLHLVPDLIDRVDYDDSMEEITTKGEGGDNHFYVDDAAAPLTIDSGDGDNTVQVGQIYRNDRVAPNVALGDEVRTRATEVDVDDESIAPDHLSYGVSHPTTINGGSGDDQFTVYSNRAHLNLNGADGDDLFVIRAFVLDGTVEAAGGDGDDQFDYVQNEKVEIDGGGGFNTLMIIGTPFNDGFILGETGTANDGSALFGVDICPIRPLADGETASTADPKERLPQTDGCAVDVEYRRIQSVVTQALHGNDVFWVRGSDPGTHYQMYGGTDGSTFYVQDPEDGVTGVGGPVTIEGEFDPTFDVSLRKPVVLPGEDDEQAMGTQRVEYDRQDSWLIVDASSHTIDDDGRLTECEGFDTCRTDSSRVVGLGIGDGPTGPRDAIPVRVGTRRDDLGDEVPIMRDYPSGLVYHSIDEVTVELGSGDDEFTIESTHTSVNLEEIETISDTIVLGSGGDDDLQVDTIDGPTWILLGEGDDHLRVGEGAEAGDLTGIADELEVTGGAGSDDVVVDGTIASEAAGLRADLDLVRSPAGAPAWAELTELEMPGLVRHDAGVELLQILTGAGDDVANVRGSLAGRTDLIGGDGEDRTFVSSATYLGVGDGTPGILEGHLDDLVGAVHDEAGAADNLLMISDRDSDTPRTAAADEGTFAVEGLGAITYDATGTYAKGVSVWLSTGVDTIEVAGARRDEAAPATLLAWERADPTATPEARTLTTLNTGAGADELTLVMPAAHGLLVANLEAGDDRLLGGGSQSGFAAFGGAGADRIQSGAGDDLVFGDFGRVEYRDGTEVVGVLGVPDRMDLVTGLAGEPTLVETCTTQPAVSGGAVAGCFGVDGGTGGGVVHTGTGAPTAPVRNWISVGDGDDVAFGGNGADWIEATGGRNALVGDLGSVKRVLPAELGGSRTISSSDGSIDQAVLEEAFAYVVDVQDARGGAPDVILGGSARDWVFAGQGDDLVNAGSGGDIVFGGYGHDVLWGGAGDDRLYGGWGDDLVDLKLVRPPAGKKAIPTTDGWPIGSWWTGAPIVRTPGWAILAPAEDTDELPATTNGSDFVFGGEGPDAMQADVGGSGPVPGDRLIDWHGAFNVYFVCDGAYGAGRVVRLSSPSIVAKLGELAKADGAFGANGTQQVAIPRSGNTKPTHPAHPGNNFDCTAP